MCYSKIKSRHEYEAFADFIIRSVALHQNDELQLKFFKDGLRNQIFDMAVVHTGMVSKKAIESGLPKSKLTEEHIYPRNQSAKALIQMALDGCSKEKMVEAIKKFCMVHITTKEENTSLVQLQREPDYHWEIGYKVAGIELVPFEWPPRNKYVYNVDGIEYNTISDVAEAHNVSKATAQTRFASKAINSKFKGWTRRERVN